VKLTPEKATEIPEADRAKYVADYQAKLKEFLSEVDKLQVAVTGGKLDEAARIFGPDERAAKERAQGIQEGR